MLSVIILGVVCLGMFILLIIEKYAHKSEIDRLTDKILAKDFRDYATAKQIHEEEITKRKQPQEKKSQVFKV